MASWLPARRRDAHKGDFGHVLVLAGSRGMMGAGRLAVAGALRCGAGLVTWGVPDGEYAAAGGPWESMLLPLPSSGGAFSPRALRGVLDYVRRRGVTAVAAGPGFSVAPGAAGFARLLTEKVPVPLVLDADGLSAWAGRKPRRSAPWVVTPHPGEAGCLLGLSSSEVQADRPGAARRLEALFGATVLLKGAGTLILRGASSVRNGTGHPAMASGGMGDVLTGVLAGLIGQLRGAGPDDICFRAAVLGAWMHGRAGEMAARELGPAGVIASDVAVRLPKAIKEISC